MFDYFALTFKIMLHGDRRQSRKAHCTASPGLVILRQER
jgi:hypothetical protein